MYDYSIMDPLQEHNDFHYSTESELHSYWHMVNGPHCCPWDCAQYSGDFDEPEYVVDLVKYDPAYDNTLGEPPF